jgi:hypothetical protein
MASGSTSVLFGASADHNTTVDRYTVAIYRAGDPVTATPVATRDLGKPVPTSNEISAVISSLIDPLPSGSYYGVVFAVGLGGSSGSLPSANFTK